MPFLSGKLIVYACLLWVDTSYGRFGRSSGQWSPTKSYLKQSEIVFFSGKKEQKLGKRLQKKYCECIVENME